MRILIATHRAYPTLGGLEKHVHDSAVMICENDTNIEILNLAFNTKGNIDNKITENFNIKSIKSLFILNDSMPLPIFSSFKYYSTIKNFKPDVIHTHGRYFPSTVIAYIYAKQNKVPIIHTEHIEAEIQFSNPIIKKFVNYLIDIFAKKLYKFATQTTAVSSPAVDFLTKRYKQQTILIPNFISPLYLNTLKISSTNKYDLSSQLDKNKVNMYFPYRLVSSKGYSEAIQLALNNNWINLFIAGDGEGRQKVQKVANHNSNINYLGKLKFEDSINVLQQVDVLLNLSSQEGLSTTILEALFFEKAIIATPIPSNKYLEKYTKSRFYNDKLNQQTIRQLIQVKPKTSGYDIIKSMKATVAHTSKTYYNLYKTIIPTGGIK